MSADGGTRRDADDVPPHTGTVPEDGRVALVSGGDEGLGPQVVQRLSALGMRVVLGCRSVERGRGVIDGLGELADRVAVRHLDVTDVDGVARLVAWISDRLGRCDVVVCNVTLAGGEELDGRQSDLEAVRHQLWSNLRGIQRLAHTMVPLMRGSGYGRVVIVLANGSLPIGSVPTAYRMARSAVNALTTVLSEELGDDGILVNAYCVPPGAATEARHAVETSIRLATLPDDGPTGRLYG